jgi:diguanylate cyclase (GGDEF)-like protein
MVGSLIMALSFFSWLEHHWQTLSLALSGAWWMGRSRQDLQRRQAQLQQRALFDELTGLPNHLQYLESMQHAMDSATSQVCAQPAQGDRSVALLLLTPDRAQTMADTLGPQVGDLLLQQVALRLAQHTRQMLRQEDAPLVARCAGPVFAIMLHQGNAPLAAALAQRLGQAFEAPLLVGEHSIHTGVHIGLACWPDHAGDAAQLHRAASEALAAAQQSGRTGGSRIQHFSLALREEGSCNLKLLSELRRAIDRGQLQLHLQPQATLDTGTVVGAQVQLYWQHPQQGLLASETFMPLANQTDVAAAVNLWAFESSARLWQHLHNQGLTLKLSLALGLSDLADSSLPRKLDALLVRHRAPAEAFCLQLSEETLMRDPLTAQTMLERLSALGFRLAIDNFGSGYCCLTTLKNLPIDELKLAPIFGQNMSTDVDDANIVRATIGLAHNLGMTVLASGVATAKTWDLLRDLGSDTAQGDHLGSCLPADEFRAWCGIWAARHSPASVATSMMLH